LEFTCSFGSDAKGKLDPWLLPGGHKPDLCVSRF